MLFLYFLPSFDNKKVHQPMNSKSFIELKETVVIEQIEKQI